MNSIIFTVFPYFFFLLLHMKEKAIGNKNSSAVCCIITVWLIEMILAEKYVSVCLSFKTIYAEIESKLSVSCVERLFRCLSYCIYCIFFLFLFFLFKQHLYFSNDEWFHSYIVHFSFVCHSIRENSFCSSFFSGPFIIFTMCAYYNSTFFFVALNRVF